MLERVDHSITVSYLQADAPLLSAVKSIDPTPAHVNIFESKIIYIH